MHGASRIRLAGIADAAAVAALMCEFRDWWGYAAPGDAAMRAGIERLLAEPSTDFLLGGDPPAGVCQLRYRFGVWHGAPDCWLEDLFVTEAARGSGLGRALVEAALERGRERGCARIELDVNEANAAAVALYEGLGFSSWAEPPGGRTLLMRRRLEAPGVEEAVRGIFDAFNRRDLDVGVLLTDDAEVVPLRGVLEDVVYRGPEALAELERAADAAWSERRVELLTIETRGDAALVTGRLRLRGEASGAPTEQAVAWAIRLRGGRLARLATHLSAEAARAELGWE